MTGILARSNTHLAETSAIVEPPEIILRHDGIDIFASRQPPTLRNRLVVHIVPIISNVRVLPEIAPRPLTSRSVTHIRWKGISLLGDEGITSLVTRIDCYNLAQRSRIGVDHIVGILCQYLLFHPADLVAVLVPSVNQEILKGIDRTGNIRVISRA